MRVSDQQLLSHRAEGGVLREGEGGARQAGRPQQKTLPRARW